MNQPIELAPGPAPRERRVEVWRADRTAGGARLLGAVLLFAASFLVAGATVPYGADLYDEGLVANGAALALQGYLPGASFYAPYPPGAFCALALAFRLWGVRLIVERWAAAVLAMLAAAVGYGLVSGVRGRSLETRPEELLDPWLVSLAAALLLAVRWVTPVNGGALVLVLVSGWALRAALPRGTLVGAFLCGASIGAAALWRLDFGFYALLAGLGVWLLFAGWGSRPGAPRHRRLTGAAILVVGMLAVCGPPLGRILAEGGQRAADSLFWWPITSTGAARLPWGRYWVTFLTPLAAALLAMRAAPILRRDPSRAALVSWLLLVGAGFLAYALGRTHATHLLPLRVVSLLLASVCLTRGEQDTSVLSRERGSALLRAVSPRTLERVILLALVGANAVAPAREYLRDRKAAARRTLSLPGPRGAGVYPPRHVAEGYCQLVPYLDQNLPAGAPIFCGAPRHDLFLKDDNLAYFLSGRRPGTYYWCLDSGVTSTLAVQMDMVRELAASNPQAVVFRTDCFNREHNAASRSSGIHLLDGYLRSHFQLAASWKNYQVYRPRPAAALKREPRSSPRLQTDERGIFLPSGRRGSPRPSSLRAGGTT